MKLISIPFIFLLFISCSRPDESSLPSGDVFVDEIRTALPEVKMVPQAIFDQTSIRIPVRFSMDSKGRYVVAEGRTWLVYLVDKDGTELSRKGGIGSGPGEFQLINHIYIDEQDRLYVLDLRLRRVTVFKIEEDELVYEKTITAEPVDDLRLREIFVYDGEWFGVFRQIEEPRTGEHRHLLYRLDGQLQPVELLLEMDGFERINLGNHYDDNHLAAVQPKWGMQKEWFYYATTDKFEMTLLNTSTKEIRREVYLKAMERPKGPVAIQFFQEKIEEIGHIYPHLEDLIMEQKDLPLFSSFATEGNNVVLSVFYAGGDENEGVAILVDRESGEAGYLRVPKDFYIFAMHDNTLAGIHYEDAYSAHPVALTIQE